MSSGTSSKQLDKETDARFVGYFGAVGEGRLALGAIIAIAPELIASNLKLRLAEAQEILEVVDPIARLRRVDSMHTP